MRHAFAIAALALAFTVVAQDETPEERQMRFADGMLKRGFYEEAADEYAKYISDFPQGQYLGDARYRRAESQFGARDVESASSAFTEFIEKHPEHPDRAQAQLRRAQCLYQLGRGSEAVPVLEALSRADDMAVQSGAAYYLGKIWYDEKDFEKSIEVLGRFNGDLEGTAHAPFARYQLANALEDAERPDEAAQAFVSASKILTGPLKADAAMNAGRIYMQTQQPARGATLYAELAKLDDDEMAQAAGAQLPWALIQADEFEKALEAVNTFEKRFGDLRAGELALAQGRAAEGLGNIDDARAAYSRAAEVGDGHFQGRAYFRLARMDFDMGKYDEALASLEKALPKFEDTPEWAAAAQLLIGDTHRSLDDFDAARSAYAIVHEQYRETPSAPAAMFYSAEISARSKPPVSVDRAVTTYGYIAKKYPESPFAIRAQFASADLLFETANFEIAAEQYEAIEATLPDEAPKEQRKSIVMRCAAANYNAGNTEAATRWYQRYLKSYPNASESGEIHVRLGEMMVESDPAAAEEYFRKALESDAKDPWPGRARAGLGLALYEREAFDEAAKVLRDVVRKHPRVALSPTAYAWLGQRLFDAGDYGGSAEVFQAMIASHPEDPRRATAYLILGRALELGEKLPEAIDAYTKAIEAKLSDSEARYRLAVVHERSEDWDKALTHFEAGAQEEGEWSAASRLGWARVLHRQGKHADAARQYMLIGIVYQDPVLTPLALHGATLCYEALGDGKASNVRSELAASYPSFEAPDDPFAIPEIHP